MNEIQNDDLIAAASELSTEISPERDLWPDIEAAINRPQRSRWTLMLAQAAVVVLLVGASSMVTYLAVKNDQPVDGSQQAFIRIGPELLFESAAYGNLGDDYQQAHLDVSSQLHRELQKLSPEPRADVERNLAVIRQAMEDINQALAKEPDNVLLQDLLVKAYREELVLMNRVGNLTRRLMSRQDI